jgi:hypothetical protein
MQLATRRRVQGRAERNLVLLSAPTRRLLVGWLGLALGSLVVAGFFAMLAAFARTPLVYTLFSASQFHLALTAHVTFAFTVWFVAFAATLWVYVAWRSGYPLSSPLPWRCPPQARRRWRCPPSWPRASHTSTTICP